MSKIDKFSLYLAQDEAELDILMKSKILITFGFSLFASASALAGSLYCPQNAGYITTGMTQDQVLAACGPPLAKQQSNAAVTEKIPVKQLLYTSINTGSFYPGLNSAYYNQWSLPSGSTGLGIEVDVVNDKVSAVNINGTATNAMSVCGGSSIQIGSSVNQVYAACGTPTMINNSFINQAIPNNSKPEVWIYQVNQYQSPISLTFINGKLQSIN